jgi:hypothetical protein
MAVQLTMILIVFAKNSQKSLPAFLICTLLSAVPKGVLAFAWMFELTAELMSPELMLLRVLRLRLTPQRAKARTRAAVRAKAQLDLAEVKAVARSIARAKVVLAKDFHRVPLLVEVKELTAVVTARLVVMVPMKVFQVFSINQYGSY